MLGIYGFMGIQDAQGTVSFLNGEWIFGGVNCTDGSTTTYDSGCPYPLCPILVNDCNGILGGPALVDDCGVCQAAYLIILLLTYLHLLVIQAV